MIGEAPEAATMSPVRRVAGIVLIFMLVGPPVGGLVFLAGRWLLFIVEGWFAGTLRPASGGLLEIVASALVGILALPIFAIGAAPYSYLYGIASAAIAGFGIGILRVKYGRLNPSVVLVVGGLIGLIYAVAMSQLIQATASTINQLLAASFGMSRYLLYVISCVVATFACWRFARSFPV